MIAKQSEGKWHVENDGDEKGECEEVGTQFSQRALMWGAVGSFADIWLSFRDWLAAYLAGHSPKSKPRRRPLCECIHVQAACFWIRHAPRGFCGPLEPTEAISLT